MAAAIEMDLLCGGFMDEHMASCVADGICISSDTYIRMQMLYIDLIWTHLWFYCGTSIRIELTYALMESNVHLYQIYYIFSLVQRYFNNNTNESKSISTYYGQFIDGRELTINYGAQYSLSGLK